MKFTVKASSSYTDIPVIHILKSKVQIASKLHTNGE